MTYAGSQLTVSISSVNICGMEQRQTLMEMQHDIVSLLTRMDSAVYTCDCMEGDQQQHTCGVQHDILSFLTLQQ